MIQGYQPPELLIRQSFQNVDSATRERLSALVIGPQYTWADPSADTIPTVDAAAGATDYALEYTTAAGSTVEANLAGGYRVDASSIQAWAKDAYITLSNTLSTDGQADLATPNELRTPTILRSTVGTLDAQYHGREVQYGDYVSFTEDLSARPGLRKVVGFLGKLSLPDYTEFANYGSNPITGAAAGMSALSKPANVSTVTGGTTALAIAVPTIVGSYLTNGYHYTDASGNVRVGAKATLRVLTFDLGNNSGTLVASFEDGLTAAVNVPFTWNTGTRALTIASGQIPLVGVTANIVITYMAGQFPAVGDTTVVKVDAPYARATNANFVVADAFSSYPVKNNRFYVKAKTGTAISGSGPYTYASSVVTIYDTLGIVPATDVTVTRGTDITIPIGSTGLTVTIQDIDTLTQSGFRKGDIYFTDYTAPAASKTEYDGVLLDGPAAIGDNVTQLINNITFREKASTLELKPQDFVGGELPITVDTETGIASLDNTSSWTKYVSAFTTGNQYRTLNPAVSGDDVQIYLTWRASKIPAESDGVIQIASVSDLSELGELDPKNDLAFGARAALQGALGRAVYALQTAGPEVADFEAALAKIERHDYTYALAPLSSDKAVGKLVANHCTDMSAEDVKNFRRAYFGVESPGDYIVADTTPDGDPYTATITAATGGNLRVQIVEDIDLNALGVIPGDFIVVDGVSYTIKTVQPSGTELLLKTGPDLPYSVSTDIVIWRKDTADSQASYVENVAKFINNRRCPVVWTEGGNTYDASGNLVPAKVYFTAAFVAGLRSATTPWLGLSRAEIPFLVSAPPMYLRYKRTLLNRVASNGVFIITQSVEDGPVFVRHQLTSDTTHGSLVFEDSVGTNIDDLSFQFKDAFEPLIGITNVTTETLKVAKQRGHDILVGARTSQTDPLIGPQLIQFFNKDMEPGDITVMAHPKFRDRIIAKSFVEVPTPNNSTIIELTAVSGISNL